MSKLDETPHFIWWRDNGRLEPQIWWQGLDFEYGKKEKEEKIASAHKIPDGTWTMDELIKKYPARIAPENDHRELETS